MGHVFPEFCGFGNAARNFAPYPRVVRRANQLSAT